MKEVIERLNWLAYKCKDKAITPDVKDDVKYALEEIERLNNIINEFEKWLDEDLKQVYRDAGHRHNLILEVLDKLQELKGSDKK